MSDKNEMTTEEKLAIIDKYHSNNQNLQSIVDILKQLNHGVKLLYKEETDTLKRLALIDMSRIAVYAVGKCTDEIARQKGVNK
jgi:hypothetical protein